MRAKTIRSVLKRKLDEWVQSITDTQLQNLIRDNAIVTGGSIASMLLGEQVSDFDVYFKTKAAAYRAATYYVDLFKLNTPTKFADFKQSVDIKVEDVDGRVRVVVKSAGIASSDGATNYRYFEGGVDPQNVDAYEYVDAALSVMNQMRREGVADYMPVFLSANAITLSAKIQVVLRFYGEPEKIHETYDFVHCMNYYDYKSNTLVLKPEALESLLTKELVYRGSKYPLCSVVRLRKFIKRGFFVNAGQILKMLFQLNELNLNDVFVLEDQLIGVDAAYFQEVISILKNRKDSGKPIDSAYLIETIDKIF